MNELIQHLKRLDDKTLQSRRYFEYFLKSKGERLPRKDFLNFAGENAKLPIGLRTTLPYTADLAKTIFDFIVKAEEDIREYEQSIEDLIKNDWKINDPTKIQEKKADIFKDYTYRVLLGKVNEKFGDSSSELEQKNLLIFLTFLNTNRVKDDSFESLFSKYLNQEKKQLTCFLLPAKEINTSTVLYCINNLASSGEYQRVGVDKCKNFVIESVNMKSIEDQKTYFKACQKLLSSGKGLSAEGKELLNKIHQELQNKSELKSKSFGQKLAELFGFGKNKSESVSVKTTGDRKLSKEEVRLNKIDKKLNALVDLKEKENRAFSKNELKEIKQLKKEVEKLKSHTSQEVKMKAEKVFDNFNQRIIKPADKQTPVVDASSKIDKAETKPAITRAHVEDHPMAQRYNGPSGK